MRAGQLSAARRMAGAATARRCAAGLLAGVVVLAAGCASLPPPSTQRVVSTAVVDTAGTRLAASIAPVARAHPGRSGIHAMPDAYDAFAARVVLAVTADKSIDAQYFIWHDDQVGLLLFEALWKAAERGVRVRLLLDDGGTAGIDEMLAMLDAHPNMELRLYNPFVLRASRTLGYLGDFQRLNRRMHNKSFTADNLVSIVGGRNIANEYLGAAGDVGFADLDVLMVGPVVQQVSHDFDRYWNSASAYPAADFVGAAPPDAAARLKARFAAAHADPQSVDYLNAVTEATILRQLLDRTLPLDWTTAQVLSDDPAKTLDPGQRIEVLLFPALMERLGRPRKSFDIISPYFVPGDDGTALLVALAQAGVKVRVLTNSLASSDERIVHAGYMKRRRELLRAGVELYELKPSANEQSLKVRGRFGAGKVAGLHAKTYAVDGERIFVGSFNFDQRSARLNTEMGVVIDSPQGAAEVGEVFEQNAPELAYRVQLAPDGETLIWTERDASGQEVRYDVDPQTDWLKRFGLGLLSGLPIDWLL
jgi:putative cardiolipin synthase